MTALAVIAKPPLPGRAKTRLAPELTLEEAAEVAAALLADTIDVARRADVSRRILFWDGDVLPAWADGFELIRQPEGDLDERLGYLFDVVDEPLVLVGMDTPQLRPDHLAGLDPWPAGADAVFGPAEDGGFWLLGMRKPDGGLIRGVPMSRSDTGAHQIARLHGANLLVQLRATLTDVDDHSTAQRLADELPRTAFGTVFHAVDARRAVTA